MGKSVMPIRSWTTGNGKEMSGRLSRQGLPPALLHFSMQQQIEPAFRKAMGDVLDGGPCHHKRLGKLAIVSSISQLQYDPGPREGVSIRLALTHKL